MNNAMGQLTAKSSFISAWLLLASVITVWAQKPEIKIVDKLITGTNDVVAIKGNNFGGDLTKLTVYFGAVKASVISATNEVITVSVPSGATYDNISVTHSTSGLTGYSSPQFMLNFGGATDEIFSDTHLTTQVDFASEKTLYDLCLCDFNGDGKTDVASANQGSDNAFSVYQNTSTLTAISFTRTTQLLGRKTLFAKCGDLDGDGKPDLVLTETDSGDPSSIPQLYIYKNTSGANISFAAPITISIPIADRKNDKLEIADIDLDGKPEIILGAQGRTNKIVILINQSPKGTIQFNTTPFTVTIPEIDVPTSTGLGSLAVDDLNNDRLPEIIFSRYQSNDIFILQNKSTPGAFSFSPAVKVGTSSKNIVSIKVGDLDGDKKPDIAFAAYLNINAVTILQNKSSGSTLSFTMLTGPATFDKGSFSLDFGDLNGDGKTDMVVANIRSQTDPFTSVTAPAIQVFINTSAAVGSFSFTPIIKKTTYITRTVCIGDINGDGKPDIALTSVDDLSVPLLSSRISILRNTFCMQPSLSPIGPLNICDGALPTSLTSTTGGGITFNWTRNAIPVTEPDNVFDITTATGVGTYEYQVRATSEGGSCVKSSNKVNVTISSGSVGAVTASSTPAVVCKGNAATLSATNLGGGVTYEWAGPEGYSATGNSVSVPSMSIEKAGEYTVSVKAPSGCVAKKVSVNVSVVDIPAIAITYTGANVICSGDTKKLSTTSSSPSYSYEWLRDNVSVALTPEYDANQSGSYVCKITPPGCLPISTDPVSLTVRAIPTADFNFTPAAPCKGQEVSFNNQSTSDPLITFAWKFGDSGTSTDLHPKHVYNTTVGSPFQVELIASYSGSCPSAPTQHPITISTAPTVTIQESAPVFCPGEELTLTVPGTFDSYAWSTGGSGASIIVTESGTYSVSVTIPGCVIGATKTVTQKVATVAVSASPESIRQGESSQLTATGLMDFTWTPAETLSDATSASPTASPLATTAYTVTGKDLDNACTNEATITVTVEGSAIASLLEPENFFSPNNDSKNDFWLVGKIDQFPQCAITVYDDKGVKVFEAQPYTNTWDGTFKGKALPDGVYYYVIRCEGQEGAPRAGSITLIR